MPTRHRDKLVELIGTWYVEAGKYQVMPVDGRGTQRFAEERPQITLGRTSYDIFPGTQAIPPNAGPNVLNRSHSITAYATVPNGGGEGMLLRHGGTDGGYALFMKDGKLQYVHNFCAIEYFHVVAPEPVPEGQHELRYEFEVTGDADFAHGKGTPGRGQLYIDGQLVAGIDLPVTTPLSLGLTSGIQAGIATGAPIGDFWEPDFEFNGDLKKVTVDVSGEVIKDTEAELRMLMARQ